MPEISDENRSWKLVRLTGSWLKAAVLRISLLEVRDVAVEFWFLLPSDL